MYIDHPQFPRPKSQPNLLCSLLISIDRIYAYHSQWNRTPTYQLTKPNIIDVSHRGSCASNTYRDKSKRNEEKTRQVITFCHLYYFCFLSSEYHQLKIKIKTKKKFFFERLSIFIYFFSLYIKIYPFLT
jgi:hypothetical protein